VTKKRLIKVDLTAWELGEWPEDLWKAVSIDKDRYSIDINVDESLFHSLIRKIIHEAIETYLKNAAFYFYEDGLHIQEPNEYTTECTVSMRELHFENKAAVDALKARIKEQEDDWKDDQ
jgi:hypothetical protein